MGAAFTSSLFRMPKRSRDQPSSSKTINIELYENLTFEEVHCVICQSILIEPVTLPCKCTTRIKTTVCRSCFLDMQDEAKSTCNSACPVCRTRLSTWARRNSKEKFTGSVNRSLEKAIQEQLPRLESEGRRVPQPIISAAGGIQMEYESQMKRARREFQADRLKEEEQNMAAITEMLAKDELDAQERLAAKFQHETIDEQIRRDELVARRLAHDLTSTSANYVRNDMSTAEAERVRKK